MTMNIYGDGLRLLEHFIQYAFLYPEQLASVMFYDLDGFSRRLRCLDKAFKNALDEDSLCNF